MLHLPAIAKEAGITIDLKKINEISERTPNLLKLAPAGNNFIEDLDAAGGIQAMLVITSYSIHYTKLYETPRPTAARRSSGS